MTSSLGEIGRDIAARLQDRFDPDFLEVRDDSAQHAGHMGAHPAGETHFHIVIKSTAFDGLSRVAAHRQINTALADHLSGHVHALQITIQKD